MNIFGWFDMKNLKFLLLTSTITCRIAKKKIIENIHVFVLHDYNSIITI
jgi:hypothetical protein